MTLRYDIVMHDFIPPSAPRSLLGRIRDVLGRFRDHWEPKPPQARRKLIPEYELYEPPPSRWEKVKSVGWDDVQFVAFIVMVCLAVPLALIVVLTVIASGRSFPSWLFTVVIILGVGTLLSFCVAYFDQFFTGEGGGG